MKWFLIRIIGWWHQRKLNSLNELIKKYDTMISEKNLYEKLIKDIKDKNEEGVEQCLKELNLLK